jgi:hypothetical protein
MVAPSPTTTPTSTSAPIISDSPTSESAHPETIGRLRLAFSGRKITDDPYLGRNAWILNEGEAAVLLPNSSNTVWIGFSGDGEYLGYTRESTQNIVELSASRVGDTPGLLVSPEWFSKMGKHPDKPVIPMDLH